MLVEGLDLTPLMTRVQEKSEEDARLDKVIMAARRLKRKLPVVESKAADGSGLVK